MKRTGQSCLSNFAAVQTCCVVTLRIPQTRYFQYCPFVLAVCQAGTLPEPRKTSTKMSETVLHENIIIPRFNWRNCFVQNRKQQAVALQAWLIHTYCCRPCFPENVRYPELLIWSQTAAQGKQTGGFHTVKNISAFSFLLKQTRISKHYQFYL